MSEVTKTQVCEKYIEEIDKTMNFLQLMRQHCERAIIEEETKDCGMCCDGMNDPENRGYMWANQRRNLYRHNQQAEELRQLKGMELQLKNNVFLKGWDGNVDMMCDILTHYDQMRFPEGTFKEKQRPCGGVRLVFVRESDLPPEIQQYLHECRIQYMRNLFGR
ncbi:MAG: hypothetical protein NC489_26150 [Ruminococcus flavefaciens]|nr:hypothetical protein [Ruminococcus flavefaciens]